MFNLLGIKPGADPVKKLRYDQKNTFPFPVEIIRREISNRFIF